MKSIYTPTDVIIDSSLLSFIDDKMMAKGKSGFLLINKNGHAVTANVEFWKVNAQFNHKYHSSDDLFLPDFFSSYPREFQMNIDEVLRGKKTESKFLLSNGTSSLSYDASVSAIKNDEGLVDGICVIFSEGQIIERKTPSFDTKDEAFFRSVIENSIDVFMLADESWHITYCGPAVQNVLGYTDKEMIGINALDRIHPDDKDKVRDWLVEVRKAPGLLLSHEYRVKNKSGNWVWVENNAKNMLHDKSLAGILMHVRNIQAKKIADQAFIQSEQRLSLLLNNTEESFIIVNSRLRIITYNRAAQEHSPFFFSKELQSGISVLDLVKAEDIPEYFELFENVFQGKVMEKETKHFDRNGKTHVFNHTFRPLFDVHSDIFGVFITSTDITVRRKLSEELDLHSERLKTAQKIARLGYFEFTFKTSHFFASEQFYEILDIQDRNQNWLDFSIIDSMGHPEDKERVKKEIERSVKRGMDFNVEFRIVLKDGTEKVILAIGGSEKGADGKPLKFRVTLQDITASKMAILAIQTLEGRFKSLFENSIDGILLSNNQGEIISANPSLCKMLGYKQEEISKVKRWDLFDHQTPEVQEMLEVRERTGEYIGELEFKHKDGHKIPVEISSNIIKDGKGNDYFSTIVRDITEKKKIESEQKALTQELLKNNQDLQQFSFITSHNLRAPVANLISLMNLYNKNDIADSFNQVLIEKFEEATLQLNQTLNDLVEVLVIKSNTTIEKENIILPDLYNEVKKNIDNLLVDQKGKIEVDFSEINSIYYNRIQLSSIFLNMISNAIRYRSPEREPYIKIRSYKEEEDWIVLEFKDNGLGLDLKRYGDRLFGLYQRFHPNKEGKGLGLYMTKSQIIAMGGKIEVDSQPGEGTTFTIHFKS